MRFPGLIRINGLIPFAPELGAKSGPTPLGTSGFVALLRAFCQLGHE